MKRIIVNVVGAAAFSGGILMAGVGSAAAAPQGIPLESAPIADSGSSAGNLLAGILGTGSAAIKCMAGGGDWSSFPRSADGPTGCLPSGYGISATSGGVSPADPIADPGTGSASGSAQLLLKCLTSGSSVAPGDPMGFPAICR